jgi:hypothetical protein
MSLRSSPSVPLLERPSVTLALGVILASAMVLLIEAVFVMSTGWAFAESILGGRLKWNSLLLLLFMPCTTAALLNHFRARPAAQRWAFVACVVAFAACACWFSVEFTRQTS